MALLNYSTEVPEDKSIVEIQAALRKAGARRVAVDYNARDEPASVSFWLETPFGRREFRMPAPDQAKVLKLLQQTFDDFKRRGKRTDHMTVSEEQARRVSWRIMKDWLEAQSAIVEVGAVTLDQVMTPYLVVDDTGTTLYRSLVDTGARYLPHTSKVAANR